MTLTEAFKHDFLGFVGARFYLFSNAYKRRNRIASIENCILFGDSK
jgi:hypothetical protein